MANGFPTAAGGFTKGFLGGLEIGGNIQERRRKGVLAQTQAETEQTKAETAQTTANTVKLEKSRASILNINKELKGKNFTQQKSILSTFSESVQDPVVKAHIDAKLKLNESDSLAYDQAISKMDVALKSGDNTEASLQLEIAGDIVGRDSAIYKAAKFPRAASAFNELSRITDLQRTIITDPERKATDEEAALINSIPQLEQQLATFSKDKDGLFAEYIDLKRQFNEDVAKAQGIGGTVSRTRFDAKTELARNALRSELNREPTDAEVFDKVESLTTETVEEATAKAGKKSEITLQQKEFEDFQKQVGDSDREIKKNIKSNAVIDLGLQQLEKGIISGTFAKAELAFKKALSKAGLVNPETQEKITTTESYAGLMGIRVGQVISLFGAGTGLSDADREFATKIAAGDITLDETSLNRLQKLNKQVLIEEAIIHNDLIDEFNLVRDDRGLKPSIRKAVDINKFLPKGNGKQIDSDNAKLFFAASKGDPREAERLASEKGWKF